MKLCRRIYTSPDRSADKQVDVVSDKKDEVNLELAKRLGAT